MITLKPMYVRNIDGRNQPVTIRVNVAANQTIEVGDILTINSTTRKAELATSTSANLIGLANQKITTDGTVTDADSIPVVLFASAVVRIPYTGSLAESNLYLTEFDLSDHETLDAGSTSVGVAKVISFDDETAEVIIVNDAYALA